MEQDKSERLVVIPYVNIQEIIGESNKIIEYKFNNPIFKNIVNDSSLKYILLTSDLKSTKYSFLIAIKTELIAMEEIRSNSSGGNGITLKLRIIEVVRINTNTIRHLDEQIAMAHYSTMCSPGFTTIKNDIEKLILDIRYIQDEHMPNLPEFDPKSNTEFLEQYSYRLSFFIVRIVSKVVDIGNLEEFFDGHALTILRKVRYTLLQYLKIKAKEQQEKQEPTFQKKLLSGEILPLILLKSSNKKMIIPLIRCYDNIYMSNSIKNQLMKCTRILQGKRCYVALIPELDVNSQENITKKHLGVLVSLHSMFTQSPRKEYSIPTAKIMPEKTVMVSIVQKHQGKYGNQEYTFYCTVEDVEYEVSDHEKLQVLINKSLDVFRRCKDSLYHLPRYSKYLANNINYAAKLSIYIIHYIWFRSDNFWSLLKINNLEKRFEAIELTLLQLLNNKKKVAAQKVASNANESIKEVSKIPEGFNIILFYVEVEKYLSLSTFEALCKKLCKFQNRLYIKI